VPNVSLALTLLTYLRVQNSTTPFWNMDYEKQLEQKTSNMKQILRKTLFKIEKVNNDIFYWLQQQKDNNEGMCCPLSDILPSVWLFIKQILL
jgi:hypothetical protein